MPAAWKGAVLARPYDEHGAIDPVERPRRAFAQHRLEQVEVDRAVDVRLHDAGGDRGPDAVAVQHRPAHEGAPQARARHQRADVRHEAPVDPVAAGEEAPGPRGGPGPLGPPHRGRERDHGPRSPAPGELEGEPPAERVPHQVTGPDAGRIHVLRHRVDQGFGADRHSWWQRPPERVAPQRHREHVVALGEAVEHRVPVVPGAREAVDQHERIAAAASESLGRAHPANPSNRTRPTGFRRFLGHLEERGAILPGRTYLASAPPP